jgi:hypothetical protein
MEELTGNNCFKARKLFDSMGMRSEEQSVVFSDDQQLTSAERRLQQLVHSPFPAATSRETQGEDRSMDLLTRQPP